MFGPTGGMMVDSVCVALPDFDRGPGEDLAAAACHTTDQKQGRPFGDHPIAVYRNQIGIRVAGSLSGIAWIKRAQRLRRRRPVGALCMNGRCERRQRCASHTRDEMAPRQGRSIIGTVHVFLRDGSDSVA
jgi:hypothetical protein